MIDATIDATLHDKQKGFWCEEVLPTKAKFRNFWIFSYFCGFKFQKYVVFYLPYVVYVVFYSFYDL